MNNSDLINEFVDSKIEANKSKIAELKVQLEKIRKEHKDRGLEYVYQYFSDPYIFGKYDEEKGELIANAKAIVTEINQYMNAINHLETFRAAVEKAAVEEDETVREIDEILTNWLRPFPSVPVTE